MNKWKDVVDGKNRYIIQVKMDGWKSDIMD